MQITKDLSKLGVVKKTMYRWLNRLVVITALTLMVASAIFMVTRITPDLMTLFIVPRIETYTSLTWLISLYVAAIICYEFFLYGIVKRALARNKLYAVD